MLFILTINKLNFQASKIIYDHLYKFIYNKKSKFYFLYVKANF